MSACSLPSVALPLDQIPQQKPVALLRVLGAGAEERDVLILGQLRDEPQPVD